MILYFSGTGNSEYVAKALADNLRDVLVNVFDYIKDDASGTFDSNTPYVFVAPVYLATMPKIVRDFIARSTFTGNNCFYFVATCAGSKAGSFINDSKILTDSMGKRWKGCYTVVMPQNYISMFKSTPPEEQEARLKKALVDAETMAEQIRENTSFRCIIEKNSIYKMTKIAEKMYLKSGTSTKKFYTTDACIGCGACVNMCPMNNIKLVDNKPQWIGNCSHCTACLNRCPKHAVEVGNKTQGKIRYVCKPYTPKNN